MYSNITKIFALYILKGDIVMKIGILTYHRTNNVGAVLQNYALQQVLLESGISVETIDYFCDAIEKQNRIWGVSGWKEVVKRLISIKPYIIREKKFNKFRKKYLILSGEKYSRSDIKSANDRYDKFVVGSDQVWNLKLNGNDMTFFLDFVYNDFKKYSYAGSFGSSELLENTKALVLKELKEFSSILVRENEAKVMLEKENIDSTVVLDPTLLLPQEKWIELIEDQPNIKINKPFVFVYIVANTPDLLDAALDYANRKQMDVYCMHYNYRKYSKCNNLRSVSPNEFLYYIKNAEKVFCSSFHAVCFSIIFEKNFTCALDKNKKNNNSRLITLCSNLELENTILDNGIEEEIIYENVNQKLKHYREISLNVIKRSLEES